MLGGNRKPMLLMVVAVVASVAATAAAVAAVEHGAAAGTTSPAPAVPDPQVKCTCYPCGISCPQIPLPPPPPSSEYWPMPYGPPPPSSEYWPIPYGPPPPSPYLYTMGTPGNLYPFDSTYFPSRAAAGRPSWTAGPVPVFVVAVMFAVLQLWWL